MKQTRISQEPLFLDYVPIEARFVPFQRSIIWHYNNIFWKHYLLWEKTYNEDYESSLPNNVPFSHKLSYIRDSSQRFFALLMQLAKTNNLPEKIIIIEQGPGSGVYAKGFLDKLKAWSTPQLPFYQRIIYVLSDTSSAVLASCKKTLGDHKNHIELYQQSSNRAIPKKYLHQALLVRHGNVWDQFPAQLFHVSAKSVEEIQTRAMLDVSFEKYLKTIAPVIGLPTFAKQIRNGYFEQVITQHPLLWKPLIRNIRLEVKRKPISALSFQRLSYKTSLETIAKQCKGLEEVLFSESVLHNLTDISQLIDWEKGGYIEIVDIIVRSFSQLQKRRRPLKFDGAVAVFINGPLLKDYMRRKGKYVGFQKLKHLNTITTIADYSLETILGKKVFVTIAEIAAKHDENKRTLVTKAKKLLDMQVDFVTFSDRAHGWTDFLPIEQLLEKEIFPTIGSSFLLSVFATRRKTPEQIQQLIPLLKKQGMRNLLVVTGDPGEYDSSSLTSLDGLSLLSKHFFTGAVAKPTVADIPKTMEKIAAGAKFFIVQSTYDKKQWEEWVAEVKRKKLHKKVHFIQSLIPIITKKTLTAIQAFPDVPVSTDILQQFAVLPDEQVAKAGREVAKQLVKDYKQAGIFSGVYIFSRSFPVIADMLTIVHA